MSIAQDTRDRVIALEAKVDARFDAILKELQDAKQGRARLYNKIDQFEEKLDETEVAAKDSAKRLGAIEPTVADINKWRERGVGAVLLISFAAASIGGILTALGKKIWAFLSG